MEEKRESSKKEEVEVKLEFEDIPEVAEELEAEVAAEEEKVVEKTSKKKTKSWPPKMKKDEKVWVVFKGNVAVGSSEGIRFKNGVPQRVPKDVAEKICESVYFKIVDEIKED